MAVRLGKKAAQGGAGAASRPPVRCIVTDVDGTLLDSRHRLPATARAALLAAEAAGVPLVLATGKARGPWTRDIFPQLGTPMPGCYLQGLITYDAAGAVLDEVEMDHDLARRAIAFAVDKGVTLIAYCGERILCAQTDRHTDRLIEYNEPTPEAVGDLADVVGRVAIQKVLFMASEERVQEIRPDAAAVLGDGRDTTLVTALPGMLEALPPGCSKGKGVAKLMASLGIASENVLALGDGENDVEMLEWAGTSVAMASAATGSRGNLTGLTPARESQGNAGPQALAAADWRVGTNDEGGWASAIETLVLEPAEASTKGCKGLSSE